MIIITANVLNIMKKFRDSFENMSVLSAITLVLGELFILFILLACLAYTVYALQLNQNFADLHELLKMNYALYENAVAGLCIVWGGSLFIDYMDKNSQNL